MFLFVIFMEDVESYMFSCPNLIWSQAAAALK